jgi:hypothetical protein
MKKDFNKNNRKNRYVSAAEKRYFKAMREARQKKLTKEQQVELAYLQKDAFEYGLNHSYSNHYMWERLEHVEQSLAEES